VKALRTSRLPPQSSKILIWTGTLWQGEMQALGTIIRAFASTEIDAAWALDKAYRDWLEQQSAEVQAKHREHLAHENAPVSVT